MHRGDNRPGANEKTVVRRMFIDSRHRDVRLYPNAAYFCVDLVPALRGVKYIALTDLKFPIVAEPPEYVAVSLRNIQADQIVQDHSGCSFSPNTIAIVPVQPYEPGAEFCIHQPAHAKNSGGSWRLEFPQALPLLSSLTIEVTTWFPNTAAAPAHPLNWWRRIEMVRYPLADESTAAAPLAENNVLVGLQVATQL